VPGYFHTNSLSKTVFSVSDFSRALFRRFQRFEKPLYGMKTVFSVKPLFKRFQRFESVLNRGAVRSEKTDL